MELLELNPDLKSDRVEVQAKLTEPEDSPNYFCVGLGNYLCWAETPQELKFLVLLSESLQRGVNFEDSWSRAIRITKDDAGFSRLVYELQPNDTDQIDYWFYRLIEQGVDLARARELATEIVPVLQQIAVLESPEQFLTDYGREIRKTLMEKLS